MRYFVMLCLGLMLGACAQQPATDSESSQRQQVTQQLEQFLYGASINDAAVHDRFWADELTYTSSSGSRFDKSVLMQAVQAEGLIAKEHVDTWYKADNVQVHFYNGVALLTFTLIAQPSDPEQAVQRFFNSGVLVQRDGHWQAVNWQATVAH